MDLEVPELLIILFKDLFILDIEKERGKGGAEGERLQVDSTLSVEPDEGLNLTTLGS